MVRIFLAKKVRIFILAASRHHARNRRTEEEAESLKLFFVERDRSNWVCWTTIGPGTRVTGLRDDAFCITIVPADCAKCSKSQGIRHRVYHLSQDWSG